MNLKKSILLCTTIFQIFALSAQERGLIFRTQVTPYDTRHDAESGLRNQSGYTIEFSPKAGGMTTEGILSVQQTDIPYAWTDGNIYLHLENVGTAYTLYINGTRVGDVEDSCVPHDFAIRDFVKSGMNDIQVVQRRSRTPQIDSAAPTREAFSGSYLYHQNSRSIRDFEVALVPDSLGRNFGMLDLKIIAQNSFNYPETVTVGYDIYSPDGKLQEFNIVDMKIEGRSTDTLRLQPFIYGTYAYQWQSSPKNPPLYKVMLFTRRNGAYKEYMPLKVGFKKIEFRDGTFYNFGKPLRLKSADYTSAADAKTTQTQLQALKRQGYNTITPLYPQPAWFYALCDKLGLYVIDRANISAPEQRENRKVGGTPSNDPALAGEYIERVKSMYYRSRNFTCVIAYSLGSPSGNGYNMYQAYRWLKAQGDARPVIYTDADGEWNSDLQ